MRIRKWVIAWPIRLVVGLLGFGMVAVPATAATVNAVWNSVTDVPITADGYTATGNTVNFTLNFAPPTGTDLTVVNNTGLPFITGTFDNLAQGQVVPLSYGGVTYRFVANYFGGSGNDLVLVWASTRAFAWGNNESDQLGDNTGVWRYVPVAVDTSATNSAFFGRTVLAISAGNGHSLGLCSDGTVAAWGDNQAGELGNRLPFSKVPVAVNAAPGISALYSKTVTGLAAGYAHSLAVCSDGTVVAWGDDGAGELGDNGVSGWVTYVPVAVNTNSGLSMLHGKTVVAVAAGQVQSLALCSDGTVAAWGYNGDGQLGDNTRTTRYTPVAVNTDAGVSALYGKKAVQIAAGYAHSLVLCSDGTVVAWGWNSDGQLGDNTTTNHLVPVAVNTALGVSALYGKTVVSIAAGGFHSVALCSDGTVATWGQNSYGQLGDNTGTSRLAPVAVNTNSGVSALYGKTAVAVSAGLYHSVAQCSDGTVTTWGWNFYGQLGDDTRATRLAPVAVDTTSLAASQRLLKVLSGSQATHTLALVAAPPASETALTALQKVPGGPFQFTFTNTPGAFFGVLTATNAMLPLSNWTGLGDPTEVTPGQFQIIDSQATNSPQRFYRVRSP